MAADEHHERLGARVLDSAFAVLASLALLAAVALTQAVPLPHLDRGSSSWSAVVALFVTYRVVRRLGLVGSLLDRWT